MFRLCFPFPLMELFAGGAILMLGAIMLAQRKSKQGDGQMMDGNARVIRNFTILAVFTVLGFLFFTFAWRPC